jgi:hypothetical protein
VTDLASRSGRDHPYPRLARIVGWLDKQKSQAVLRYQGGTVNRPVGRLSLLVKAGKTIPTAGLLFDSEIQADARLLESNRAELVTNEASDADVDVDKPNQMMAQEEPAMVASGPGAVEPTVVPTAPRRSKRDSRPPVRFQ